MNVAGALAVLGIDTDASEDVIRARYRELVKRYPPERMPDQFARLRAAYELAIDPRTRAAERVLGPTPYLDLDDLREDLRSQPRRPLSVATWLEVMRS